jgi:hypothetical protein
MLVQPWRPASSRSMGSYVREKHSHSPHSDRPLFRTACQRHIRVTGLDEQSHNKASGGPVVVDGAQDGDLDAVLLPDRPRQVDHACVCHTSGVRLRVP